jgi:hypothetical protein
MKENSDGDIKRTVFAPGTSNAMLPGALNSVQLSADEDVVWTWTHQPRRHSYVSGFDIIKKSDTDYHVKPSVKSGFIGF